jgi:tetratricopeptide (TPR) repeat protein
VSPRTLHRYAFQFLLPLGRFSEAIALNERAVAEDPLAPLTQGCLSACYYFSRQYRTCVDFADRKLNGPVNFWVVDMWAGTSLMAIGQLEPALDYFERARQRGPAEALICALTGLCLKRLHRAEAAEALWRQAANKSAFTEAFFRIDDAADEAMMDLLHQQISDRHQNSARVGVDPLWDRFRGHPRYAEALRRMNLSVALQPLASTPVATRDE